MSWAHSAGILVCEVSGQHLSLMEQSGNDNRVRIVDIERNQMAGLSHRRASEILSTPFQVVNKIALSNVIDGSHTGASGIVAEILQGLLDQPPITPKRLVPEACSTAFEYFGDVASRRAGNTNPPHTRESGVELTRSSSSIISNRVAL
jgi:hypothetical protein